MVYLGSRIRCLPCAEHAVACQGCADAAHRHSLSRMDWHRSCGYGVAGHRVLPRASIVPAPVLHHHADCLHHWAETCVTLTTYPTAGLLHQSMCGMNFRFVTFRRLLLTVSACCPRVCKKHRFAVRKSLFWPAKRLVLQAGTAQFETVTIAVQQKQFRQRVNSISYKKWK